jgi:hypothetical protein
MKTRVFLPLMLIVAVALAAAGWQWTQNRRVDGRSGSEWLTRVEHAAQTVPYHAEGRTTVEGKEARFTIDQGTGGRYCMRIVDEKGRGCSLGFDGERTWYSAEEKVESMETGVSRTEIPLHGRVTGTAIIAGRPAVLLVVRSSSLKKLIAVDREKDVILSIRTTFRDKKVSEMVLEKIEYRAAGPEEQTPDATAVLRASTTPQLTKLLGRPMLRPGWLPQGFKLEGTYQDRCPCCDTEMAVLRYTDGLATLTLFEMRGNMMCAMEGGCHLAPGENALVESRNIGDLTVAAVGTLTAKELDRILDSLK